MALVTGGATRVGKAIVENLAQRGYQVLFTWNRSRPGKFTTKSGPTPVPFRADLTDPSQVELLSQAALEMHPRLDLLVHNASIYSPDPSDPAAKLALSRSMAAIHVDAPLLLTDRLSRRLQASKGCVITMLDIQIWRPHPRYSIYCASKASLANLTRSWARQLAPRVRVNGIAPGVVDWPSGLSKAERAAYLAKVPLRRAGTHDDVAQLVWFLATGGAYVTGQIIALDGGRSIA